MGVYRRLSMWLIVSVLAAGAALPLSAADTPPLAEKASMHARSLVVRSAERYLGTPYLYGGESARGMDCSGLVYTAYLEATGVRVPRTVATLSSWVQKITLADLQPGDLVFFSLQPGGMQANHVGIAAGERSFIHSTSQGARTGVIRSSLSDPSWASRALYGGRALPSSTLPGSFVHLGLMAIIPEEDILNLAGKGTWGFAFSAGAALSLPFGLAAGIETGFRTDPASGIFRVPLELAIGRPVGLTLFAGPVLTLSAQTFQPLDSGDTFVRYGHTYLPSSSLFGTFGIRHGSRLFSSGSYRGDFIAELRYDNYLRAPGQPADMTADLQACVNLSFGLRLRILQF
jgi:hypothetical protein